MAGAVFGFHHHLLGVVSPAFDKGVGAGDPVDQGQVPAVAVVQVVNKVPWIDFMDGNDAQGVVVEVCQPLFLLNGGPFGFNGSDVVEGLGRLSFKSAGGVHGSEGVSHVGRGLNYLTAVLRRYGNQVQVYQGLPDVLQHVPGIRKQSLSRRVAPGDIRHYIGYAPAW